SITGGDFIFRSSFLKTACCQGAGSEALLSNYIIYFPVPSHSRAVEFVLLGVISFSDHKCKPCPKTWHWHRNSCYYFATNEEKTWPNSRKSCMDKNSTLVKIDSLEEKVFLKSQPLPKFSFFWLGLSWDPSGQRWLWEDGTLLSPSL
uniref:C-type lectin domain-containing protein n=1 Tax=Sus scrofa TaxID=9823 RepID=A0A8D0UXC5_PIG